MDQRVPARTPGASAGTAAAVVHEDLEHICGSLKEELEAMRGRRLLVTGGAGFLGHYFVQAILHANRRFEGSPIRLTVFDSFVRGEPAWFTRLQGDPNLTVVRHDMTRPLPADMGDYEFVIHAASIASPTYYRRHPIATMDANVNGLRALLDHAHAQQERGRPLGGFLFLSSSEIYGDPSPEHIPTAETYRGYVSCTGPRACYDEAKRYGETLCVNFAAELGLPVRMARPFNNYGPGLKISDRRVLPDFARDIMAGRDVVMLSDGSPRRTFCYVADAVIGYYKVLVKGRSGEAYNIGVETPEVSMAEVGERMAGLSRDLFGYSGKVVRGESQDSAYLVDNPNRRCPVITKARSELGYDPVVGLDEGLRRSLRWYRENATAEDS